MRTEVGKNLVRAAVFRRDGAAILADVNDHATQVAGVMISKDTGALAGVAPEAELCPGSA